jgi:hypothetical protein
MICLALFQVFSVEKRRSEAMHCKQATQLHAGSSMMANWVMLMEA